MIGYKIAKVQSNNKQKRVLVTLEIPQDAKTNLNRSDIVDATKAKYRCNKAKVIKIEDIECRKYLEVTTLFYSDKKLKYVVGKEVEEKSYNEDNEVVCGEEIHFCLDKEVALMYGLEVVKEGLFQDWWSNGQKLVKCTYRDGKKEGLYQRWFENGQISEQHTYKNGKENGLYETWHSNGQKWIECTYQDGIKVGKAKCWYSDGRICENCDYEIFNTK